MATLTPVTDYPAAANSAVAAASEQAAASSAAAASSSEQAAASSAAAASSSEQAALSHAVSLTGNVIKNITGLVGGTIVQLSLLEMDNSSFEFIGVPLGAINVQLQAGSAFAKHYVIDNSSTVTLSVLVVGSAATPLSIPSGKKVLIYSTGIDAEGLHAIYNASLDANNEVIELQAGSTSQMSVGNTTFVKRADGLWQDMRAPIATLAQAQAGTDNVNTMTSLRVKDSITANANQIYDLSAATIDQVLNVGDKAVYAFTAAATVPLHIACGDGQKYRLSYSSTKAGASTANSVVIRPNNLTYTGAMHRSSLYSNNSTVAANQLLASHIYIVFGSSNALTNTLITCNTIGKMCLSNMTGVNNTTWYTGTIGTVWKDTTTVWSSLGTIALDIGVETLDGTILVERVL